MKPHLLLLFILTFVLSNLTLAQGLQKGFFDFEFKEDKLLMKVDKVDQEFLLVTSVASGIGSNDIGVDRGKLGSTRIVQFKKTGSKLFLIESNTTYRARSKNEKEVKAVEEAFGRSILWAGKIEFTEGDTYIVDISDFLLGDENDIISTLKKKNQGNFTLDKKRSLIDGENLLAFPKNIELEVYLTFKGDPKGSYLKSVVPSANSVSIKQHFSFIQLPDDDFKPRKFHTYSGYFVNKFYDYASQIDQPLASRWIHRHRLEKKDPSLAVSEVNEPIVYYVDAGCPEPIKSALMEGARWWSTAFEQAGFKNAFLVQELPDGAHPLDIRYNVIQWVHRSTRGWSYGATVSDPRTGEIIKGHVSLGSLRVRQDFMIAQGLLSPYTDLIENNAPLLEMALARLRQLSAHEVGHTLGLAHNFAASVNDRASVMDYPHPFVIQEFPGTINLDNAYDDKIGKWDIQTIKYGYSQFDPLEDEEAELQNILLETKRMNLLYISDNDARPKGGAHPYAHLWDNGEDPVEELERIMNLRADALQRFGANTLQEGIPFSELEKKMVPVYLMHRYQVEAVSKLVGGVNYNYAVKGFNEVLNEEVSPERQTKALEALLKTLNPEYLSIPDSVLELIPPSSMGYSRNRESFKGHAGLIFDPLAVAESYTNFVFSLLLHKDRLQRIDAEDERLMQYLKTLRMGLFRMGLSVSENLEFEMIKQKSFIIHLLKLMRDENVPTQLRASAAFTLDEVHKQLNRNSKKAYSAHALFMKKLIEGSEQEGDLELPELLSMPPGSPIGCGSFH